MHFLNREFEVVYTGHAITVFIEEHLFQVQGMIYYSSLKFRKIIKFMLPVTFAVFIF